MNIELNLTEAFENAIGQALSKKRLQAVIEQQVDEALHRLIREQFERRGGVRNQLDAIVSAAMPNDLNGLTVHTDNIKKIILGRIEALQLDEIKRIIEPSLDELLKPPAPIIRLSDLIRQQVAHWKEDDHQGKGRATIHIEPDGQILGRAYWRLALDPAPSARVYGCEIQAYFMDDQCLSLSVCGRDLKQALVLGTVYEPDLTWLRIGSGVTRVEYEQVDVEALLIEVYGRHGRVSA